MMLTRHSSLFLKSALLATSLLGTCAFAQEAQGNWLIRGRAVYLDMANKSDPISSLAVPRDAITVDNKTIPEVDISYFFTPNIAAELVLTVPQRGRVTVEKSALGGATGIGSFKFLPPTLLLQYHFAPDATFRPYAGVGFNYTQVLSTDLNVPVVNIPLTLDKNSFGLAAGVGADVKIAKDVFLNFDVKYAQIGTDVRHAVTGQKISEVTLNPWLFGVGIGYRF